MIEITSHPDGAKVYVNPNYIVMIDKGAFYSSGAKLDLGLIVLAEGTRNERTIFTRETPKELFKLVEDWYRLRGHR